jgi:hypothetical protein
VFIIFGIRVDLLHNQRKKQEEELKETAGWVGHEIQRTYNGISDSSGGIFIKYAKIFELKAKFWTSLVATWNS